MHWQSDGQSIPHCRYSNQAGVEIRARDFGGLGGIDTLVPGLPSLMPMYRGLTRALKHEGYQERRDLFGAPYDFRMAADGLEQVSASSILARGQCKLAAGDDAARVLSRLCSMPSADPIRCRGKTFLGVFQESSRLFYIKDSQVLALALARPQLSILPQPSRLRLSAQTGYYADLKQLIEHAVEINSGRLATIVAHSQGALVALYFMAKQPSEWVRKHIGSFIAISAPWAGAVSTLKGTNAPNAPCAQHRLPLVRPVG